MGDEPSVNGGKVEAKKPPTIWDRWPGKLGVPVLMFLLGTCGTLFVGWYHRRQQALDYYVLSTSSLIQRPNLGDKPLSVMVDGRSVENLSAATLYLANRGGDDYDNVPVEVSFAMPDGSPVELVRESVTPDRFAPTTGPTTAPASRVTRRYTLGVANRQRANEALLRVEYVFANVKAPEATVYIEKKGLVAEQQQVLRKEDIDKWDFWVGVVVGCLGGMMAHVYAKVAKWAADRTSARLWRGRHKPEPSEASVA